MRKRAWLLLVVAAATVSVPRLHAAELVKGPYLIYPGRNTQMTVLWQTDAPPAALRLEWGTEKSCGASKTFGPADARDKDGELYAFTISRLKPGTLYHYRLTVDGEAVAGTFRSAPAEKAEKVTFYAYGDTRSNSEAHEAVCAALLEDAAADPERRQTLVLHSGDWVGCGDVDRDWDRYFERANENTWTLLTRMPMMGCLGNHDGSGALFGRYWPYPFRSEEGCYFSFDYGPVHFSVVDQYVPFERGSEQYKWLQQDLLSSPRGWKVVLLHEPAWSCGHHPNDERTQAELCPLFRRAGVAVVICGHNHAYARCAVDGIQHITCGGGGAPLYEVDPEQPFLAITESTRNFVRFDVDKESCSLCAMREDGSVIETLTLRRDAPASTPAAPMTAYELLAWAGLPVPIFLVALAFLPWLFRRRASSLRGAAALRRRRARLAASECLVACAVCLYLIYVCPRIHHEPGNMTVVLAYGPLAVCIGLFFSALRGGASWVRGVAAYGLLLCLYLAWTHVHAPLHGLAY